MEDYFADVGLTADDYKRPTLARIRSDMVGVVSAIDPDAGTYCQMKLGDERNIEIRAWLPRGPSLRIMVLVLAVACREMKRRNPNAGPYTISGVPAFGVDLQGLPDEGKSISDAWKDFFGKAQNQNVVRERTRDGLKEYYSTLDVLLAVFDRLGI